MATISEMKTHYSDLGTGPPVVLIHALGLNSSMWTLQVPALGQHHRVVRYDVRGHGRTPYDGERLSITDLADDLLALMDYLRIDQAAILGISMGGMITQAFAAAYPERVTTLVLISTVSTFPEQGKVGLLDRARTVEEQGMGPMVEPALERWFTDDFRSRALNSPLVEGTGDGLMVHSNANQYEASVLSDISSMILAADRRGYAAVCRALASADLTAGLKNISAPSLILSGALDPGVSTSSLEDLAANIAQSTQVVVPRSSHLVPLEAPEVFNAHVLRFLSTA